MSEQTLSEQVPGDAFAVPRVSASPVGKVIACPLVCRESSNPGGAVHSGSRLDVAIDTATRALLQEQHQPGYWCFELEADSTIPAEFSLMMHHMDEVDVALEQRIARYLRARQRDDGWGLFPDGPFDLSGSVKAYYALKLGGDDVRARHMRRVREAILDHGGADRSNVFTRITLAMFQQLPWRGVPAVPVEIVLMPRWSPFHLGKISYWSRAVIVPLSILCSLRARARNPGGVGIRELFHHAPEQDRGYFSAQDSLARAFLALDRVTYHGQRILPGPLRRHALARARSWLVERLNGEAGLGGIFPAMVNAYEALALLGYDASHPHRRNARAALRSLIVDNGDQAYCQPCVSPVWDTALCCLALQESSNPDAHEGTQRALGWLKARQLVDVPGDWSVSRPDLRGGGWPFQFRNDHYPDLDDTSAVAWAMDRCCDERFMESVALATDWLCGMQSSNGGFASFDVDNTCEYLNRIPFADHGALIDPPTVDVSARCATLLARRGLKKPDHGRALQRCLAYLLREQESDGSWYGRWGANYIYGTWSVLVALEQAGVPGQHPAVQRAVRWLRCRQRSDGGWGESLHSYFDTSCAGKGEVSTAFQTAWAMLGLMAAGEVDSHSVRRGAQYLLATQGADGFWHGEAYTAPGFPRVLHLKYHGYNKYFPLWALARYRNLRGTDP